uniref:Uncharacterized protein n=1 Tax=Auxenochlorella protothecoides TaxID=3075 RepID=A0A1D2ACA1_AUXPR
MLCTALGNIEKTLKEYARPGVRAWIDSSLRAASFRPPACNGVNPYSSNWIRLVDTIQPSGSRVYSTPFTAYFLFLRSIHGPLPTDYPRLTAEWNSRAPTESPSRSPPEARPTHMTSLDMATKEAVELLAGCFAPQRSAPLGACVTSNQPSRELEPRDEPCAKELEVEGSNIHPVLQLGWAPLCTVVCNGLYGEFLGGHDKDLYIRCISSGYEDLPDTDIGTGGRIMTCSQFERVAGRELSKKWKESIHVVGCGEGSRATLLSWLKCAAEARFGAGVVGEDVCVCWTSDGKLHRGRITGYSRDSGKHRVAYSEKCVEDLHLPVELVRLGGGRGLGAASPPASPAGGRGARGEASLRHLSSGESASSSFRSGAGAGAPGLGEAGGQAPAAGPAPQVVRAAKRARTGYGARPEEDAEERPGWSPEPATTPDRGHALPAPPALQLRGRDEAGVMCAWMHRLAVVLERAAEGSGRKGPSVPAAFQALLALSAHSERVVRGLFEALLARLQGCADQTLESTARQLLGIMEAAVQLEMAGRGR